MILWKAEFIIWHEARLDECGYPPALRAELRRSRDKWLATVK